MVAPRQKDCASPADVVDPLLWRDAQFMLGRHSGSDLAERKIASGWSSRSVCICRSQSGWCRHSIVALSRCMRCDSPPQSRTAEKFT